jgi:hypothetical protein
MHSLIVLVGAISNLALNAASDQTRWPGPLDYVREHPWWVLTAALIPATAFAAANLFFKEGPAAPTAPGSNIDMRGSTFAAPVNIGQVGDGPSSTTAANPSESAEIQASEDSTSLRPIVLYTLSAFLQNDGWELDWEEEVRDATSLANSQAYCIPLDQHDATRPDIAAVLVICSAAQFNTVKKATRAKLRTASIHKSSARVILVAVGLTNEPPDISDGNKILSDCGYNEAEAKFLIFHTKDELQQRLYQHIKTAISIAENRFLLGERERTTSADGELS